MKRQTIRLVVAFLLLSLSLFSAGCQPRRLAPELDYSASDVETIRDEIKSYDWE